MTIYPIDEQIERIFANYTDEETGELKKYIIGPTGYPREVPLSEQEEAAAAGLSYEYLDTEAMMQQELEEAQINFDTMIHSLRNEVINKASDAAALKAEKLKLSRRQQIAENASERAKRFLAYLLKGEKYDDGVCKISYRKSENVVIDDDFVEWASVNAPGLLKVEPEPRKADIKAAIKRGTMFDHAHLEIKNNIQVK